MLELPAMAQFNVIYNFTGGSDGGNPVTGVTLNPGGSLFGTTPGGTSSPGSIYELRYVNSGWIFAPLYTFHGTDGASPFSAVTLAPNGVVYGTTSAGGGNNDGLVYSLRPSPTVPLAANSPWHETELYSFTGEPDGAGPVRDLAVDSAGNLYGTTQQGGTYGMGAVYMLTPVNGGWLESVLWSFSGGSDGGSPSGGVVIDAAGNLYGTAGGGGDPACKCGVVFQLTPSMSGWSETVLYNFQPSDGGIPMAGLAWDSSGHLYGGTCLPGHNGATIFGLQFFGGTWNYFSIYTFTDNTCIYDRLAVDVYGEVWGTSPTAGAYGAGKVFGLVYSSYWLYGDLKDFSGGDDGGMPFAGPTIDPLGETVYGTAYTGGLYNNGVVYGISLIGHKARVAVTSSTTNR
jgi:uncharacterized repeat protein (TIGR03803 family)